MKTLKGKLIAGITLISMFVLILTSLTIWKVFKDNLKKYIINDMEKVRSITLSEFEAIFMGNSVNDVGVAKEGFLPIFNKINKKYNCYISLDRDENINIAFIGEILSESYKKEILRNSRQRSSLLYMATENARYYVTYSYPIYYDSEYKGTLIIQRDYLSEFNNYKGIMLQIIGIEVVLYLVMLFLLSFWMSKVTRALGELNTGMKKVEEGNYLTPLRVKGKDEIATLAIHFNIMQSKIKKQMEQLSIEKKIIEELDAETKNFFNYATHEMKTPITAIKGYGELLAQGGIDEKLKPRVYSRLVIEADRIDKLVRNMLLIARSKEKLEQNKEVFNLKDLVEDIVTENEIILEIDKIKIECALKDLEITAVKEEIRTAFKNLVDNAIKYTKDKVINIYNRNNDPYCIVIKNKCDSFPSEISEHLFEPFIKYNFGDFEKVSSGLGLFICKELLEKNGAVVDYELKDNYIAFIVRLGI